MSAVLDSSAVIAFLAQEQGWELVERYLDTEKCIIHAVNLCEILYHQKRSADSEAARQATQVLDDEGVSIRGDFDLPFLQLVADYKTAPGPTALGDCFGLALAQREGIPFVTADRHELTRVAERGIVAIEFIR